MEEGGYEALKIFARFFFCLDLPVLTCVSTTCLCFVHERKTKEFPPLQTFYQRSWHVNLLCWRWERNESGKGDGESKYWSFSSFKTVWLAGGCHKQHFMYSLLCNFLISVFIVSAYWVWKRFLSSHSVFCFVSSGETSTGDSLAPTVCQVISLLLLITISVAIHTSNTLMSRIAG